MFPDRWGSDVDYHNWLNEFSQDLAREDWCKEHQQRRSTCGKCQEIVADDGPLLAAVMASLRQMSVSKRHLADSDEETGAGLAARFGEGA